MKIRTVPKDERTDIRMCEECKQKGRNGIFLVLGFFNGFICDDCANLLAESLVHSGFGYTNLAQYTPEPKLGPQEPYYCSCGAAGAHPKNIHDTERCDSPLAYDDTPYGKSPVQNLINDWRAFQAANPIGRPVEEFVESKETLLEPYPSGMDSVASMPDTPRNAQEAAVTLLGEKVTQEAWDGLQDECIALEARIQELLDWKMEVGTNWYKLKNNLNDAESYMKAVEERFIG